MRISRIQEELNIEDIGNVDKGYIKSQLPRAWRELRKVQRVSKERRQSHMDTLA